MEIYRGLSDNLFAAYDWTNAAGEIEMLKALRGVELERYCAASAANWRENPSGDEITAADVRALHEWLRNPS